MLIFRGKRLIYLSKLCLWHGSEERPSLPCYGVLEMPRNLQQFTKPEPLGIKVLSTYD